MPTNVQDICEAEVMFAVEKTQTKKWKQLITTTVDLHLHSKATRRVEDR